MYRLNEDLDDLLNLNPLPTSPAKKPETTDVPEKSKEAKTEEVSEALAKRPVPLPRKKSLGKIDIEEQKTLIRPEVSCFLVII